MRILLIFVIFYFLSIPNTSAQKSIWQQNAENCYERERELIKAKERWEIDSIKLATIINNLKNKNKSLLQRYNQKTSQFLNERSKSNILRNDIARYKKDIELLNDSIKQLNDLNMSLKDKNAVLKRYAESQEKLIEKHEELLSQDSVDISLLNKELFRRSLKAVNFSVTKKTNGHISIKYYLLDSNGEYPSKDFLDLSIKIYPLSNKEKVNTDHEGGLHLGRADISTTLSERKAKKVDISKQPIESSFTQNLAFKNSYIKKLNYQIRVLYTDGRGNKTILGTHFITKENLNNRNNVTHGKTPND